MSKVNDLCQEYGFDSSLEMAEEFFNEGTVPGICMNPGCSATYEYEPDQDKGWCEECGTNSVKSLFVLMGII
jgi:hypothetical protein